MVRARKEWSTESYEVQYTPSAPMRVAAAARACGLLAAAAVAAAEVADPATLHPAFAPLARLLPPKPEDAATWSPSHCLAFVGLVTATFEALSHVVPVVFGSVRGRIEARGRHLDVLTPKDAFFLLINRAASVPFTYHFLRSLYLLPVVQWCVDAQTAVAGSGPHSPSAPGAARAPRWAAPRWRCRCCSWCTTCSIRSSTASCTCRGARAPGGLLRPG